MYTISLIAKRVITGRSLKVITVLTVVQEVKKNGIIKLSCWNETSVTAMYTVSIIAKRVITGRNSKVITIFTTIQNVTIKSPCWDETQLITAVFITKAKENVTIES